MLITPNEVIPSLQPPGAGLPSIELRVARLLVRSQARLATRKSCALRFEREKEAILKLVEARDTKENSSRVLIKRLTGMEDSSRYWSVFMTLEHLRIANSGSGEIIRLLTRGKTPEKVTDIADLKPAPDVGEEAVDNFDRACDYFQRCVTSATNLRTQGWWQHPWFGWLDAADWNFVTAFHMGLHRRQIEAIRKEQKASQ